MKQKILPSIMAKNQKELDLDFKKLKGIVKELHLDVVDGKFAKNKAMSFNFKLKKDFSYNIHLMVKDTKKWVNLCLKKNIQTIIIHPEVADDLNALIKKIKEKKRKVGLALKPETKVKEVKDFLKDVDYVLILTVHPGFYGAKFLSAPLKKIKQIKKINPKIKIIVDGGMDPKTIKKAVKAGADLFVSGSYVTKAENPKERIKILLSSLK
jgi:ribulose-phosphate 3-epimerase